MKKIRIKKECNSNGRLKKYNKSELTKIKKSILTYYNTDNKNEERRSVKKAQKKRAQKRAQKRAYKGFFNKYYLVNIKIKETKKYSCGCEECDLYEYNKKRVYASSAEEASIEVLNSFDNYSITEVFEYGDEYYEDWYIVDRCVDTSVSIIKEIPYECYKCEPDKTLIPGYNMPWYNLDSVFNDYIYCHGLYAFNKFHTDMSIIPNRIMDILNNGENMSICCSWKTQPIGPVGIYTKGHVTLASNTDVCSYVSHGVRCFKKPNSFKYGKNQLIESPVDLDFTIHNHCEFFLEDPHIIGIWIKKWFVEDKSTNHFILEEIYKIGRDNGIPIYIVGDRRNK